MADYLRPGQRPKGSKIPTPAPPRATIPGPQQRAPTPPAPVVPYYNPGSTIPSPQQRQPTYAPAATIPAPMQRAPTPVFQAPAAPAINWGNVGGGGGGGGMAAMAAPSPEPPPDTRRQISSSGIGNGEIAQIDSTFADQDSALSEALKKFIADQTAEEGRQRRDTDTAITGIDRNKRLGLTGMSEDFAARGLQRSGLFAKANADAGSEYENQKQQTQRMLADNLAKMVAQKGKFESESNATRQSARNEALARLARRQDLKVVD